MAATRTWRRGRPPDRWRLGAWADCDVVVLTESCEFYDPDVDDECNIVDRRTLRNEVKDYINKRPSPR
jgi:hypothetical protein